MHNPEGGVIENLDELPWVTKVYKRDLDFQRYNVPFLLNPFISFYTTRGCPAMCTFCLWPQTHSGHRWRLRSSDDVAAECKYTLENFPGLKEIFFDDDTFNYRKARTIELSQEAGAAELHLELHLARHHRLRHAEGHEGRRLPAADRGL